MRNFRPPVLFALAGLLVTAALVIYVAKRRSLTPTAELTSEWERVFHSVDAEQPRDDYLGNGTFVRSFFSFVFV